MSLTTITPHQNEDSVNQINDHPNEFALVRLETIQPTALPTKIETTLSVCLL